MVRRVVAVVGLAGLLTLGGPRIPFFGFAAASAPFPTPPVATTTTSEPASAAPTAVPPSAAPTSLSPASQLVGVPCPAPGPVPPTTTELALQATAGVPYATAAGGPIVGALPLDRWGGPTVRPVVARQAGWVQVQLGTRPNNATAWIDEHAVTIGTSPYRVVISICQRSLVVYQLGQPVYSSPVGVGMPRWPTPLGPSFIAAVVAVPPRLAGVYGQSVVVTATHSNVFTEFDGGDGTVAIHAYPSNPGSTAGVASSHGCIRVNPQTIAFVRQLPVGSPIDIVA